MNTHVARLVCGLASVMALESALGGPFAPAAGQPGSLAVPKDSPALIRWAVGWTNYQVGTNCDLGWQTPELALGPALGTSFDVVSLGEGGQITLLFDPPIVDGPGPDFAVFENAFNDTFLELAYVEVSSDGVNFVRFPSHSLTAQPVPTYGALDSTDVDGLAGKYRQGYGTPFDLAVLNASEGVLDLQQVRWVRLVDIPGDGSRIDSEGRPIYDPYPTTGSGGFDLDAVGVLSNAFEEVTLVVEQPEIREWPPTPGQVRIARKSWNLDSSLVVPLIWTGTASIGEDFESPPTEVELAPSIRTIAIPIVPLADSLAEGSESIVVSLAEGSDYRVAGDTNATLFLLDRPVDQWRWAIFGAEAQSQRGADEGDPDGDGRVNLLEYALGSDPLVPDVLPALRVLRDDQRVVVWHFTRRLDLEDVALVPEVTFDLGRGQWHSGTDWFGEEGQSPVGGSIEIRAWLTESARQGPWAFVRLKAYRR